MIALGVDQSMTNFGWSIVNTQATARRRIVARGTFHTESDDFFLDRYDYLERSLRELLAKRPKVQYVGFESPIFGASYSEGAYALYVIAMRVLRDARRDVVLIEQGQLKALARGHMGGMAMDKRDIVAWVKRLVARPNEIHVKLRINEHEADATVAAWHGARFFELMAEKLGISDLSDAERHVFLREHTFTKGPRKGMTIRKGVAYREDDRYFLFSKAPHDG